MIAELRNCRTTFFLKSYEIAIAEVLLSSCGIAIADSKKIARAQLWLIVTELEPFFVCDQL